MSQFVTLWTVCPEGPQSTETDVDGSERNSTQFGLIAPTTHDQMRGWEATRKSITAVPFQRRHPFGFRLTWPYPVIFLTSAVTLRLLWSRSPSTTCSHQPTQFPACETPISDLIAANAVLGRPFSMRQ